MKTEQIGLKVEPELLRRIEKVADRDFYPTPAHVAHMALVLIMPFLEAGVPPAAFQSLSGVKRRGES